MCRSTCSPVLSGSRQAGKADRGTAGWCQGAPRPARLVPDRLGAPAATTMASQFHTPRASRWQPNHGLMRAPDCHQGETRSGRGHARPLHACGIQHLPTRANFATSSGHGQRPPSSHALPTRQLPDCPAASSTQQLTHGAQAVISLVAASELLAVAHTRSGETLEYLQSMYRVRLDQCARPSSSLAPANDII